MGEQDKPSEAFTYERLFEVLREEKRGNSLQPLSEHFYAQVEAYLRDKEQDVAKSLSASNVFTQAEAEQHQTQLRNARRIIRMLYDLREKKIMQMALNKSRTASTLIDTSNLLQSEIDLFKQIVHVLDDYRHNALQPLFQPPTNGAQPMQQASTSAVGDQPEPSGNKVLVRILDTVPELVGPDLQKYGPYNPEDIANIPKEIATALLSSHKAQQITPNV